jgi:antitoxin VapB
MPLSSGASVATGTKPTFYPQINFVYPYWKYERGTISTTTVIFKSNQTQAVRLPKDVAFPDGVRDVEITKIGNSRIISPVGQRWDSFFAAGPHVSDDFLVHRDAAAFEDHETL